MLSIVIPAYNEEARILGSLEAVAAYLKEQPYTAEVVVVSDGSVDRTAEIVEDFAQAHSNVRLVQNPHRGKGYTVKTGMLAAEGTYRFLCDADFSMPVTEIARFLPPELDNYDVAIGSREVAGARRYGEPPMRHLMGRVFNAVVQATAVPGIADTQCGFKCFHWEAAETLFSLQQIDGWAFDVEILFLARKVGFRTVEVPIQWYYGERSKINPLRDTVAMFREALSIRLGDWRGRYPIPTKRARRSEP